MVSVNKEEGLLYSGSNATGYFFSQREGFILSIDLGHSSPMNVQWNFNWMVVLLLLPLAAPVSATFTELTLSLSLAQPSLSISASSYVCLTLNAIYKFDSDSFLYNMRKNHFIASRSLASSPSSVNLLVFWISFHYERTRERKQRLFGLSNSLLENWRVDFKKISVRGFREARSFVYFI
jgi:hypothetical protein